MTHILYISSSFCILSFISLFLPSSLLFIVFLKTFHGDEDLLEVIYELCPNIPHMRSEELNLTQSVIVQAWSRYFVTLHGTICLNRVKEFWKYASVSFNGDTVSSSVFGIPITITLSTIVAMIGCTQTGKIMDDYHFNFSFAEKLFTIHDISTLFVPTNPPSYR